MLLILQAHLVMLQAHLECHYGAADKVRSSCIDDDAPLAPSLPGGNLGSECWRRQIRSHLHLQEPQCDTEYKAQEEGTSALEQATRMNTSNSLPGVWAWLLQVCLMFIRLGVAASKKVTVLSPAVLRAAYKHNSAAAHLAVLSTHV
jgi:hypothetical protein